MADEQQQTPPDELKLKERDDSSFVTEELGAMKPIFHRLLSAWNIIAGFAALWYAISIWPVDASKATAGTASDTTKVANAGVDTLTNKSVADSAKSKLVLNETIRKNIVGEEKESEDRGILLLKLSLLFGILGGATHGISSLMDFRGQRRLFRSWVLWYFGRPALGGMVSVIFYVTVRAGLFSGSTLATDNATSLYGIAAFSTLVGMFTDAATNKLAELFKTMFATKDGEREGKLTTDKPKTT